MVAICHCSAQRVSSATKRSLYLATKYFPALRVPAARRSCSRAQCAGDSVRGSMSTRGSAAVNACSNSSQMPGTGVACRIRYLGIVITVVVFWPRVTFSYSLVLPQSSVTNPIWERWSVDLQPGLADETKALLLQGCRTICQFRYPSKTLQIMQKLSFFGGRLKYFLADVVGNLRFCNFETTSRIFF